MKAKTIDNQYKLTQKSYYPFGMQMPGRSYSNNSYRYGFNGMEKDDEVSGQGNSYTTHWRQFDPRLGRWWSTDPVTHPWQSPYNTFDNNPIVIMDPSGADGEYNEDNNGKTQTFSGEVMDKDGNIHTVDGLTNDQLADKGYSPIGNGVEKTGSKNSSKVETYELTFDAGYNGAGNDFFKETDFQKLGEEIIHDGKGRSSYIYHISYINNISPWVRRLEYATLEGNNQALVHRKAIILAKIKSNSDWYDQNEKNWQDLQTGLVAMTIAMSIPVVRLGNGWNNLSGNFVSGARIGNSVSSQKMASHGHLDPNSGKSFMNSIGGAKRVLNAYNSGNSTILRVVNQYEVIVKVEGVSGTYVGASGTGQSSIFTIKGGSSVTVHPMNPISVRF